MNKLNLINQIFDEIIEEHITETAIVKDKSNLIIVHKRHKVMEGFINKMTPKFSLDWSKDIIISECYASYYEALINTVEELNLPDDKITIENETLLDIAYGKATYKMKTYLNNKNTNRGITEYKTIPFEMTTETKKEISLQNILDNNYSVNPIVDLYDDESSNQFITWFNNNKESILTKKQLAYLNGDLGVIENTQDFKYKNRIADRITKEWTLYLSELKYEPKTDRQLTILTDIINSEDMITTYERYKDKMFITDLVNEHLTYKELIDINISNNIPKSTISRLRTIFRKEVRRLEELYNN